MTAQALRRALRWVNVEVAYARADLQVLVAIEIEDGADVRTAIERSGLLARFPEIDIDCSKVGIFSQPCNLDRTLNEGDRVEIYRPLRADPQQLRRSRAAQRAGR